MQVPPRADEDVDDNLPVIRRGQVGKLVVRKDETYKRERKVDEAELGEVIS